MMHCLRRDSERVRAQPFSHVNLAARVRVMLPPAAVMMPTFLKGLLGRSAIVALFAHVSPICDRLGRRWRTKYLQAANTLMIKDRRGLYC
jgi:hypothetical protein